MIKTNKNAIKIPLTEELAKDYLTEEQWKRIERKLKKQNEHPHLTSAPDTGIRRDT